MAGTATTARSSGWLGRYLDGLTEFDSGMRGLVFASSVPLHLLGQQAKVTAVPDQGGMWGADRTATGRPRPTPRCRPTPTRPPASASGATAWRSTAGRPSGWPRRSTRSTTRRSLTTGLTHDLTLAARLVNANLGARVIGVSVSGSFDTHSNQLVRPRRAPRAARRRHRGLLRDAGPRLPRPGRPRHLLRVRAPTRAQRQRRDGPRHVEPHARRRRERQGRPPRRRAVADHPRLTGQLRAAGRLPTGLRDAARQVARRRPGAAARRDLRPARPVHERPRRTARRRSRRLPRPTLPSRSRTGPPSSDSSSPTFPSSPPPGRSWCSPG